MSYKVSPAYNLQEISLNESDTVKSILQNILCLLKTKKGSCPMYRDFGLDMDWLDKPMNIAKQMMYRDIKEGILKWETRAELVDISFEINSSMPGYLNPIVEVELVDEQ